MEILKSSIMQNNRLIPGIWWIGKWLAFQLVKKSGPNCTENEQRMYVDAVSVDGNFADIMWSNILELYYSWYPVTFELPNLWWVKITISLLYHIVIYPFRCPHFSYTLKEHDKLQEYYVSIVASVLLSNN